MLKVNSLHITKMQDLSDYSDEEAGYKVSLDTKASPKKTSMNRKFINILKTILIASVVIYEIINLGSRYYKQDYPVEEDNSDEFAPVDPVRPLSYQTDSNSADKIYFDEDFRKHSIEKLAGAVRIETESYDDNPDPLDDLTNWIKFYKFHDYLKETFPTVYENLKVEKIDKISLLYTWEGTDPDLKPLLLTAHQDVVPVEPKTKNLWAHDPYGGVFDGEFIWGRGVSDCKNLLIGTLEAVEQLIKDGFKPTRTVLLGFGNDEESTGRGAAAINRTLTDRYGTDSIYAVVDEGTGVLKIDGQYVAIPATAEKGHLDIFVELTTPGGHSSVPPDHTSIGIISKLVTLLESNPYEPIFSSQNPLSQFLQVIAKDSKTIPDSVKKDIQNAHKDKNANKRVIEFLSRDPTFKYSIQTSQAVDIIHGGVKANALPEYVTLLVNQRISVDSNANETVEHFLKYLKTVSKEFDLGISLEGETIIPATKNGEFKLSLRGLFDPAPITPSSGDVWDLFAGTIKHVYDDIVLKDTNETLKVAPFLMVGNTDTRQYWGLTKNIFRFEASELDANDITSGIHSVNERLTPNQHLQVITFLYELILNTDKAKD